MRIALAFGAWCLTFRGTLDFTGHRQDPRGLSGSEYGFIRIAEELHKLGHDVTIYTVSKDTAWRGMPIRPVKELSEVDRMTDVCIAFNEPELLRDGKARVRVCDQWLNSFEYCKEGFEKHVDLWLSPSDGHREMILGEPHVVQLGSKDPILYRADPAKWRTLYLGCDPERYPIDAVKVPGRVVYCSSPDRGLHLLLQEWPAIKRAVPHATLRIFYRLQAWIDSFRDVAYSPPIEALRTRAVYIQECLRRMAGPEWGITVCDSVSREQIEREMSEAECLAFPCDTTRYTEGFSCTTLEACAAQACPVIFDTDALGGIYQKHCIVVPRGEIREWRDNVIEALTSEPFRKAWNETAREFAEKNTWRLHAERLVEMIREKN